MDYHNMNQTLSPLPPSTSTSSGHDEEHKEHNEEEEDIEEIEIMSSLSSSSSVSQNNNTYDINNTSNQMNSNVTESPKKNTIDNFQNLSPKVKRTRPFLLPSLPTIPSGGAIHDDSSDQEQQQQMIKHRHHHQGQHISAADNDDDKYFSERDVGNNMNGVSNRIISQDNLIKEEEEKKEQNQQLSPQLLSPPRQRKSKHGNKSLVAAPPPPPSQNTSSSNKSKKKKKKIDLMQSRRRRKIATIESDSGSSFYTPPIIQQKDAEVIIQQDESHYEKLPIQGEKQENYEKKILSLFNQYECILRRRAIVKEEDKERHLDSQRRISPSSLSSSSSSLSPPIPQRRKLFTKTFSPPSKITTNSSLSDTNFNHDITQKFIKNSKETNPGEEIYGDTTLGMKLTILSGKVIVQNVMPLNDGRASPAQLSGYIKKGDVIISINDKSLSFLPFENVNVLVDRLAPLSHPSSADGLVYDREVKIRFEIGKGMKLLEKDGKKVGVDNKMQVAGSNNVTVPKSKATITTAKADGASDLFNLSKFTFVDQLSGTPLFFDDEQYERPPKQPESPVATIEVSTAVTPKLKNEAKPKKSILPRQPLLTLPSRKSALLQNTYQSQHQALERRLSNIGYACSIERVMDFVRYSNSGYFLLNQNFSRILSQQPNFYIMIYGNKTDTVADDRSVLSPKEMISFGKRVLLGVGILIDQIEYATKKKKTFDPLKMVHDECLSFSSRSRFSQRSKLSQRRNFLLQVSSHDETGHDDDDEGSTSFDDNLMNDSDSLGSDILAENNGVGGDEMLLRLAAWNKTWKEQMVETLDAASVHKNKTDEKQKQGIKKFDANHLNKADTLEFQLQNLFFGEQVIDAISQKKPSTLPPDEMTEVIYDLALSVNTTVPLNVNIIGELDSSLANIPLSEHDENIPPRLSSTKKSTEILEGTRFLLDDIIPLWLDTFRPIQIQQRRVLWPLNKDGSSSIGTPDDLSVSSSATGWSASSPDRRESLEKRVASIELDPDTRTETYVMLNFYFVTIIFIK